VGNITKKKKNTKAIKSFAKDVRTNTTTLRRMSYITMKLTTTKVF